jgi:hypothetical protein
VTIFSLVEIALALLGLYVLFGLDELRIAGRTLRGQKLALVGILLFTPLPFAILIGSMSGATRQLAQKAAAKPWERASAEAVEDLAWLDPAGIAVSAGLIGLVFMLFGKPDDRKPESEEGLARDGWQDPPDWRLRAAQLSSEPLPAEQPKRPEQMTPQAAQTQASDNDAVRPAGEPKSIKSQSTPSASESDL